MELHCRYHPTRVPVLMCSQCAVTVCPDCVPSWPDRGMPRCITCRAEMEPLGISEYVKPFWQCFDRFFKFPFKAGNLKFLLLTLVLSFLVPITSSAGGGLFGIIGWVLFLSFMVAYLSAVGIKGSDGSTEPPEVTEAWNDGGFLLFFKALIIMFVFLIAVGLVTGFIGGGVAFVLTLFGAMAFPASLMLLFLEKDISSAISPSRILGVIQAIGMPYLFLWGLVTMLTSGPDIMMSLPDSILQSDIFSRLVLLVNIYFALVLFHLLGYVVYQYHFELGVALPSEQVDGFRAVRTPEKATIIESELLIMDGRYSSAIQLLQHSLQKNSRQDQVWLKLYELVGAVSNSKDSMDVTEDYIGYLLSQQQNTKVVRVLRRLLGTTPQLKFCDFSNPEQIEKFLRDEKEVELLVQFI